jgi:diaminopropionate ammonia-lyase
MIQIPDLGQLLENPSADAARLARSVDRLFPAAAVARAAEEIRAWPGYAPTPLVELPDDTHGGAVATVRVKDERPRFGLGSFKALGGALAVLRDAGSRDDRPVYVCGSAGNHGLSVAWGAQRAGCSCTVYLPEGASPRRVARLQALGARVEVVPGSYDEALAFAREAAGRSTVVVSDYSDAEDPVTLLVMYGYCLLAREVLAAGFSPTHVFVPAGVGGLAAAVVAVLADRGEGGGARIVVVEPTGAACVQASLRAGRRVRLATPPSTHLSPLSCAVPSAAAWPLLQWGVSAALAIDDEAVRTPEGEPAPDDCGPVSLSGFRAVLGSPEARRLLGLGIDSHVLLIRTE